MTYSSVMEKMENLNAMSEIEVKKLMLDTLVITNSMIGIKNIEKIISSSQNYQMRDYIPESLEHPTFIFEKSDDGKYNLKVVDLEGKRIDVHVTVDAENLPLEDLRIVSVDVLKQALDFFGRPMPEEQKDDFRKTLELSIDKFSTYRLMKIKEDLEGFELASEEDKKRMILEVLFKTQSYLHIDDLKRILPAEKYEAIEEHLREIVMAANPEYDDVVKAISMREKRMQKSNFTISRNSTTEIFEIESEAAIYNYELTPVVAELDLSNLDLSNLMAVAIKAMEKHREAPIFHDGLNLRGEEIPQVLDVALSTFKVKENEFVTQIHEGGDVAGENSLEESRYNQDNNVFTNNDNVRELKEKRTPDDIIPATTKVRLGFFKTIITKIQDFLKGLKKDDNQR